MSFRSSISRRGHFVAGIVSLFALFPVASQSALVTAGELVVDLRAYTLNASSTTWTNQDDTGNTVGNFTTKGGGNLNVASIGGITKSLLVDTVVNNAVLSAANAPAALLGNSTRSVEVWVYATAVTATSATVGWGTSGTGQQSSCDYNTGGNGMFAGYSMDTGWNGTPITGSWVYVVYTYDGTTVKGYTNGVLNKSAALGPLSTAAAKLGVGAARAASADPFKGYIADVRVHTGVLSASDIANNYSQGIQSILPTITGLTNQTVHVGGMLALNPVVTGFPDPAFQWRTNGTAILNQTNAALTVTNIQSSQNGFVYSLVASNSAGKVTNSMNLTVVQLPVITGLNNQAVAPGAIVIMSATVSGLPTPTLQWRFNGANVANGATGNGSTLSGSTTDTLTLTGAQVGDSGTYSLVASNSAGIVTNSLTLTVSGGNVAPSLTGPVDQTVVQSNNAVFSASVSGLPLPLLQWRVNAAEISGATNSTLAISNALYAQNGFVYSLVASNVAGMATNSATLIVLVPPAISQQPTNVSVVTGTPANFNVIADGVPAVKYQWSRNGSPIANATNAAYMLANPQGADNGALFSVTVSNSVNVVTSSNVTLTVLSTMTGTLLPTNGAVNIASDQQLRIVFSGVPKLGSGKLFVRDAMDNSIFATIDTSQFQTFSLYSATITNAAVRTVQGSGYYYMPIAIYGNEAWITCSNRFAYNKTYYVNFDATLFLDTSNASFVPISSPNTWRFSTKVSGPATPTASTGLTNITIAHDGAGDFATLQGASDWIPQNNTLKRTITIKPGIYRDYGVFKQSRNNVTIIGAGADREDVQIIYPFPANSGVNDSSAGILRLETSDIYVRNLTLDNLVYLTNNGVTWAGPINTVYTSGSRLTFDNVLLKGGQDTLFTASGTAYFNRCEIWGSTDFIYGGAVAVFDQCNIVEIKSGGGPITAPSTDDTLTYGLVFLNCTFPRALMADGYPYDVSASSTTFMRPWRQDGMTAIINCQLDSQITTKGWSEWVGAEGAKETTCRAREYGSTLISGGAAPTVAQRQAAGAYWLNTYDPDYNAAAGDLPSDPDVAPGTGTGNRLPVAVNPSDYTLAAIFGSWSPTVLPTITSQPTNQTVSAGSPASFTVAAGGLPNPVYQWRKNGTNISGATNVSFSIASTKLLDNATYSVVVSNSVGVLLSSNAVLTVPAMPTAITPAINSGTLSLSWPSIGTGYRLEMQTNLNNAGLTTNWLPVANSTATNQMLVPINPANGSVFYRLVYP